MEHRMRTLVTTAAVAVAIALVGVSGQTPAWRPGNRSLTSAEERDAAARAKALPLKPRRVGGGGGRGTQGEAAALHAPPPLGGVRHWRQRLPPGSARRPSHDAGGQGKVRRRQTGSGAARCAARQRSTDALRSGRLSALLHLYLRHGI